MIYHEIQKVCNDVAKSTPKRHDVNIYNKYAMTSNMFTVMYGHTQECNMTYTNMKSTAWHQKVNVDVKMHLKYVMTLKICHAVKEYRKYVMTPKSMESMPWRHKLRYDNKRCVMT